MHMCTSHVRCHVVYHIVASCELVNSQSPVLSDQSLFERKTCFLALHVHHLIPQSLSMAAILLLLGHLADLSIAWSYPD